ncbi:hypothetical protein [Streptomyces flaveolus]|jgi:hypothetical protein|uniref:hypothetical protein n=1 Tax=Streptomyces flaveolus TaxID=67297 RepID=UPI003816C0EE
MSTAAFLRCGNTAVVFDGPRRLAWRRGGTAGDYAPTALWPSPAQLTEVMDHLHSGGCLLVLVDQERTSVPMYAEEAERLPADVAARTTLTSDGVVSELHVPVLDWMPPALRERGLRFLHNSAGRLQDNPDLLLPQLIVEDPPYRPENLRFARLRNPRPFSDDRLTPVTDHLFTDVTDHLFTDDTPAAVLCPSDTALASVRTRETTS